MAAVELVGEDGAMLDGERMAQVHARIREEGVLVGRMSHVMAGPESLFFLSPPLILTEAEADRVVEAFRVGLASV